MRCQALDNFRYLLLQLLKINMEKVNLQLLEAHVVALVGVCHKLVEENKLLVTERTQLLAERDTLLEKNALARSRLEEMITRLRAIEMDTPHE